MVAERAVPRGCRALHGLDGRGAEEPGWLGFRLSFWQRLQLGDFFEIAYSEAFAFRFEHNKPKRQQHHLFGLANDVGLTVGKAQLEWREGVVLQHFAE